ncbi:carbohydrate ABC transporter permease [Pseudochelatococcus sp. B33]
MTVSNRLLYVFLALPMFYVVALIGFPIVYNLLMSFQGVTIGNLATLVRPLVGFDNYAVAIADPAFRTAFLNSIIFVLANVVGQIGLGLLVALFFAQNFAGSQFLRGLMLSTWLIPGLVTGALWKWMFASEYGVANFVLFALGAIGTPVYWLSDPSVALTAVIIANIWHGMPFSMLLIAAALTSIPQEQYEAAMMDGAGPVARLRFITLPALVPTLLAVACLVTIYSMRAFDLILAMTHGGPVNASTVLPLLSYQFSFEQFRFGVGAAVGTFAFIIVFGVALVYVRTLNKETAG